MDMFKLPDGALAQTKTRTQFLVSLKSLIFKLLFSARVIKIL